MRVLILGGNGFIGSDVTRRLAERGHVVSALARDTVAASLRMPDVTWRPADLASLATPSDWRPLIAEIDVVVNCAGALQDGSRDNVAAVQDVAMRALYEAARETGIKLVVQISARTKGSGAESAFLATKRSADTALRVGGLSYVILRPAVVIGRNAYGGSALLRALAAFPVATPLVHGGTPMQFVALDDVTQCICDAVEGHVPAGSEIDLAAAETLTLAKSVGLHRKWLGLAPVPTIAVSDGVARLGSRVGDMLGRLGWRSPLRSTALVVASGGVSGHSPAAGWRLKTLSETLCANPAGVQDLWFARLYLLKPLIFGTLALFWLLSGSVALLRFEASSQLLIAAGASSASASLLTVVTSLADITLGIGVLIRRHAALAMKGMIALSLAYLLGATVLAPALWADPLGPLVKVLPSIALTLAALAIFEER